MNKQGFIDLEFDTETVLALAMGVAAGIISLVVVKSAGTGVFWKAMTFIVSSLAGFIVSKFIFSK